MDASQKNVTSGNLSDGAPRVLAQGKHLRLVVTLEGWEFLERTRASLAVVIAALTDQNEVVLIEQPRPPMGGMSIEMPAGLVGDEDGAEEEHFIEAAKRELLEETGYEAKHWKLATMGPPSPGLSNEVIALVVAQGLTRVAEGGGVAGENIRVHLVPIGEVHLWLEERRASGVAVDPKIYGGLWFLGCTGR